MEKKKNQLNGMNNNNKTPKSIKDKQKQTKKNPHTHFCFHTSSKWTADVKSMGSCTCPQPTCTRSPSCCAQGTVDACQANAYVRRVGG